MSSDSSCNPVGCDRSERINYSAMHLAASRRAGCLSDKLQLANDEAMSTPTLRIGQSADPDDAFMAWALPKLLQSSSLRAELEFGDIESLNRGAIEDRLDLTALSVGAYPQVADRYRMLRAGASFGDGYGPLVVGPPGHGTGVEALAGMRVAIPGNSTTAAMLLRIFAGDSFREVVYPFDQILDAIAAGHVDAGLIIHEGQLVYEQLGLRSIFEPAAEWTRREKLPVPLGVVAVRRQLAAEVQRELADLFLESIRRGFSDSESALDFAAEHARGLDRATLEEYVYRYVNAATLDMGSSGERAINRLFECARQGGLIEVAPRVDLL